jgi:hypothetical protein
MDEKELEKKLEKYYSAFLNPKHIIGDWIIVNDNAYNKYKNKLKIESIISGVIVENGAYFICETKDKYIIFKYSDRFICYRFSDTEYGLSVDDYELFAINEKHMSLPKRGKILAFDKLCKLMSFKLSKRAKEYLDYFS